MKRTIRCFVFGIAALAIASAMPLSAAIITSTLGNTAPGFADGTVPTVPQIGAAQAGQPAPFDAGIGNDLLGPDFTALWTHNYAAIIDTILSATLVIGIADHDSAASGNQLSVFTIDGTDFFGTLNPLFEAGGEGADQQFDLYTLVLPGSSFAGLADGSASIQLDLQGPGLLTPLVGPPTESTSNGAFLISSELTITTQVIPEPSTVLLMLTGLAGVAFFKRR